MQIRIANKQDERSLRDFVEAFHKNAGEPFDLKGADRDLAHIEASYFGRDGLFLVAEDDGVVVGLAGARRRDDDDSPRKDRTLTIERFLLQPGPGEVEIADGFIDCIVGFAPRGLFSLIESELPLAERRFEDHLSRHHFSRNGDSGRLSLTVTPDF